MERMMVLVSSHLILEVIKEVRFLDYVLEHVSSVQSRNNAKKLIKSGELVLDGEQVESGRYVKSGQLIEHFQQAAPLKKVYELKLPVLYEDDYLALINKPAGLSVSGNYFRTVQNALPFNLAPSSLSDALPVARPVHRLDNQTRGLLLIAKSHKAALHLGKQFEEKTIHKSYAAVVIGKVSGSGIINTPIDAREAITRYEAMETVPSLKYKELTLLKLSPLTGRTHQLRIHLAEIGHAILGDKLYTPPALLFKGKGLFLCAMGIDFMHPKTEEHMNFTIDMPYKFKALLLREKARCQFK